MKISLIGTIHIYVCSNTDSKSKRWLINWQYFIHVERCLLPISVRYLIKIHSKGEN